MVKEYYDAVCAGNEVRKNLIALKTELKDEENRRELAYLLGGDFSVLISVLNMEDPKIRKNAALILGQMESEDLLPVLFDAYKKETTLFIKADYLKAISKMDYREWMEPLKQRLEELRSLDPAKEEGKHILEEIHVLQTMVMKYQRPVHHKFNGYRNEEDMILVTNRCQRSCTADQIKEGKITMLAGGVRVRGAHIEDILPIRTYQELLFPLQVTGVLPVDDPEETVRSLVQGDLLDFMMRTHKGKAPYYFRIELKGKTVSEKRGSYIRKLADTLEKESEGVWINSAADYEVEIRLLEKKDGTFAVMLKLYTIPERRFAYRKEAVASSIAPVNAALTAELARPYLKENAQILDPFCGVGTMLIERKRAVHASVMYGVDIYGDAIEKGRINAALSDDIIYFINKDFFEFEHEYLFDEIITDMPQVTGSYSKTAIRALYQSFFEKALRHLKEDGIMVLYATEPQFAMSVIGSGDAWKLAARFMINEKNHTEVLVIQRKNE